MKSSIKSDSCLAACLRGGGGGGGGGKEIMTFQTTSHNHVGIFSSLSWKGGRCWGLWLWIDERTNSQLQESLCEAVECQ